MAEQAHKLSIRSLFLWAVMSIATLSLVISSGLSIYNQVKIYREDLETNTITLAKLIGQTSAAYLLANQPDYLDRQLDNLSHAPRILNVHIYKNSYYQQATLNAPERFASYNREGEYLITSKVNQLDSLEAKVKLSEDRDYLEIAERIYDVETGSTVGWVYLRMSTKSFNERVGASLLLNVTVMLVLLTISFLLAIRFQRVVTAPIKHIAEFLQRTSRQRDYSARSDGSNVKELDILADAVNVMLIRIQEYMQKQKRAEEQHNKLNTSLEEIVNQRTLALKGANQELIQTLEKLHQFQRQMVQNEKMAALGDMVAGVAHEVNTPIGLGVTASTMMLDRLAVIEKDFNNKTLKASALQRFLDESKENLNIIYRNLNRAAELISSFKQVAVDQTSETSRSFCFAQLVNEILLSLQPRLKKLQHNINVNCDPTLCVEMKAGPINQILINLIMNSVIHGFENIEKGDIEISAELVTANKFKLVYRDNGKGIPDDIKKRIFDPFVTTKRGQGGSGLGMHLVYNLVTQALNGSIVLSNEEGQGVEFVIVFPIASAKKV
ncbi:HAMP domain-containing histidine kinase [Alteromonas sp. 345S023]|uniref:histidine kinase n=1 Tax=Alteromonas profundi TaxID=2696062 RepID=A0A7X5LJB6_9ALTE|nr:HAMP domain-containing sensor histidine kinase [Alteromonas profundi]NDV90343.1 HAMP domain-containing histidine kinase [Alteromonas profundi]